MRKASVHGGFLGVCVLVACSSPSPDGAPTSGSSSAATDDGPTASNAGEDDDAIDSSATTAVDPQSTGSSSGGGSETGSTASSTTASDDSGGSGEELLRVDFEADGVGLYTEDMVASDFGVAPPWNDGLDEGRATIVEERDGRFLRVTFPAGEYGPGDGGVQFVVALPGSYDELHLSYRVRFAEDFDFVKGGKLPGLVGGSSPTGCVEDIDGFSARMMWRTAGAAVQYMYFPEKVNDCGDDYPYTSDGTDLHFEGSTWHTVEHRLVMNTPGMHDGIVQAWFDGDLAVDEQAFLLRLADGTYGIDALYFSTFFGGGDSTWAPAAAQMLDFDDIVIATAMIEQ